MSMIWDSMVGVVGRGGGDEAFGLTLKMPERRLSLADWEGVNESDELESTDTARRCDVMDADDGAAGGERGGSIEERRRLAPKLLKKPPLLLVGSGREGVLRVDEDEKEEGGMREEVEDWVEPEKVSDSGRPASKPLPPPSSVDGA